ncbi:hypothetical protein KDD17_02205 [Sulfitobacter albidus]|uniref:Uncharacterized protein n=1 Tax=Sulfitobacter albidus TaxID=2829501 RepID=A0A975PMN7_9RHOB|nr:hypothetical protein [Sulfitobacter albidus]QUJ76894.1 hypothetical protein KDD17_02205 [Sulfitobacter albidus]
MLIPIALIAVIVVAWYAWTHRDVRRCRWRADRTGDRRSLRKYTCVHCGAEAFTASKGPPKDCKRGLDRRL